MNLFCSLLALLLCSTFTTTYSKEEKSAYRNSHEVGNNRKTAENVNVEAKDKKKKDKKKKDEKKNKKKNKYTPSPPTASPTKKPSSSNVRVLVTFDDRFGMQTAKNDASIKVTAEDPSWHMLGMEMTPEQVKSYKQDKLIKFVDIDHDMKNFSLPNMIALEDNIIDDNNVRRQLQEETPWGITEVLQDEDFFNNQDVKGPKKVCVADTGYGLGHNDLPMEPDVTGKDATGDFNEAWDTDGGQHGTHCSGTVAAKGNNGQGVVGVIPDNKNGNFQLLVGKALSKNGIGSASSVMKAVQGCVDQGANVVSLSLGCNNCRTQTEEAFYKDLYKKKNILLVAAAGNSGNNVRSYPASYGAIMSVASVTSTLSRSSFSQFNEQVEIAAPGSGVKSTLPGNRFATWDGTSMATPHVAGVAGLLWMHFPECKNYQIRNVLNKSARDLGSSGCEQKTGHGLVQAKDAYNLLLEGDCGGNIGPKDAVGGCNQLFNAPGPTPPTPPVQQPTTKPTKKPKKKKKKKKKKPTPEPTGSPTFTPTGTYSPTSTYTGTASSTGTAIPTGTTPPVPSPVQQPTDNDDFVELQIVLKTDNYPLDTSWQVNGPSGELVMQGGKYEKRLTQYTFEKSVKRGCYTFIIFDVWGDGVCCAWGYGYYDIKYNGSYEVYDGGEFLGNEYTEVFGDC